MAGIGDGHAVSTLIRAATVVDGTGAPRATAPTSLVDGRGSPRSGAAGGLRRPPAACVDADGLVLAPGFIDMHAHSDLQILLQPDHLAKVSQGVTTEVLGQDGLSYAPVDDAALARLRTTDRRLERRPGGLRLRLAHRGRVPGPARPRASPSTPPTSSRRAPSGCWSCGWRRPAGDRRRARTGCRSWSRRACARARSACPPG